MSKVEGKRAAPQNELTMFDHTIILLCHVNMVDRPNIMPFKQWHMA